MSEKIDALLERMRGLEKEIVRELQRKEMEFFYEVRLGKVRFTQEARARHKQMVKRFTTYIRDSRAMIVFTSPVIWACLVPILILDLTMKLYQAICFPIYGIPKVKRRDSSRFNRQTCARIAVFVR
jgi:hypothetical protein